MSRACTETLPGCVPGGDGVSRGMPAPTVVRRCLPWLAALMMLAVAGMASGAPRFVAGQDYRTVDSPEIIGNGSKVEVAEVFWYGCPHCYHFEPELEHWLAGHRAGIHFVRIPATLNPGWRMDARGYYVGRVLGVMDRKMTDAIFKAIHQQHRQLASESAWRHFYTTHGVSASDFNNAWQSFAVDAKLRRADHLVRLYGVMGVPTLVVNGKYVTSPEMAGGEDRALQVVDFLVHKARAEMHDGGS